METQLEQTREQQRVTWNKFSAGWKKWDKLALGFMKPVADNIINSVKWKDDFVVLDVASGTGEPGLTAASIVKSGKVIATDLSEDMIAVAKENASGNGLRNFEAVVSGVENLPFKDDYFDVALCRFGFMFFPDIKAAVSEIKRVLKPGGTISTAVWSVPEKNAWATTIMSVINRMVEMPETTPDTPGLFRCAKPGIISQYFNTAGLKNISEKEVQFELTSGSVDEYWNFLTEVAAPVVAGLNKADEETRQKIKKTVYESAEKNIRNGKVYFSAAATIVTAEK